MLQCTAFSTAVVPGALAIEGETAHVRGWQDGRLFPLSAVSPNRGDDENRSWLRELILVQ
jgi:hypothetical protein